MKPIPLPLPKLGMDVRSPEGELPKGVVRSASNVELTDTGAFRRAPGSVLRGALEGAHSLYSHAALGTTLVAADGKLYEATLGNPTTYEEIFSGLPLGEEVECCVLGTDIYFTAGGVLGKLCSDGLVRRPGIAELIGHTPTLTATVGALPAGRYGVAYSLTNDLGEESPLSSIAWIDLDDGGGILLSGLVNATDVAKLNTFVTAPNGRELYRNDTVTWAATASIVDQTQKRLAPKKGAVCMPGGQIVRHWRGRLVVAQGGFVVFSDPFDPGVADPAFGWLAAGARVTMLEPVEGGLFVGTANGVTFYRGTGPDDLAAVAAAEEGAWDHSGVSVPAHWFDQRLVNTSLDVAVWLSDVGLTVGMPNGEVVRPQADRIALSEGGLTRAAFAKIGGVSQSLFSVESMTTGVGGSADGTE